MLQGKGTGTHESLTVTLSCLLASTPFPSETHPKVRMELQMFPAECIVQEIGNKMSAPGKSTKEML